MVKLSSYLNVQGSRLAAVILLMQVPLCCMERPEGRATKKQKIAHAHAAPLCNLKNKIFLKAENTPDALKLMKQRFLATNVVLQSNDGKQFMLTCSAAEQSVTLKSIIENAKINVPPGELLPPIPLSKINGKVLSLIVQCLERIAAITPAPNYGIFVAQALDPLFVKVLLADAIELLKVVNYLEIKVLFDYMIALITVQLQHSIDISALAQFTQALTDETVIPKEVQNLVFDQFKKCNKIMLDQLRANKPIKKFVGHSGCIESAIFNSNGKYGLTASADGTARLLDLTKLKAVKILKSNAGSDVAPLNSLAISLDDNKVLASSSKSSIKSVNSLPSLSSIIYLWDLTPVGKTLMPYKIFDDVDCDKGSITFYLDEKHALWSSGNRAYILDLNASKRESLHANSKNTTDHVVGKLLANSCDGKYALIFSSASLCLWDCPSERLIKKITWSLEPPYCAALSFDAKRALISVDKEIQLWNLENDKLIKTLVGHRGKVKLITFSQDSKYALTVESNAYIALLWDLSTGTIIQWMRHTNNITAIALSWNCRRTLVGLCDGSVCLWDNLSVVISELTLAQLVVLNKLFIGFNSNQLRYNPYFNRICNELPNGLIDAVASFSSKRSINPISRLRPIVPKSLN